MSGIESSTADINVSELDILPAETLPVTEETGYEDHEVLWLLDIFRNREVWLSAERFVGNDPVSSKEKQLEEAADFCLRFADDPWTEGRFSVLLDDGGMKLRWQNEKLDLEAEAAGYRQELLAQIVCEYPAGHTGAPLVPIREIPIERRQYSGQEQQVYPTVISETGRIPERLPSYEFEIAIRDGTVAETPLSNGGLMIVEYKGERHVFIGDRHINMPVTTMNILETLASYTAGLTPYELTAVIRPLVKHRLTEESVAAHLELLVCALRGTETFNKTLLVNRDTRYSVEDAVFEKIA